MIADDERGRGMKRGSEDEDDATANERDGDGHKARDSECDTTSKKMIQ